MLDGKAWYPGVSDRDQGLNASAGLRRGLAISAKSAKCGSDGSDRDNNTPCLIATEGDNGTEQLLGASVQLHQCRRMLLLMLNIFQHLLQA